MLRYDGEEPDPRVAHGHAQEVEETPDQEHSGKAPQQSARRASEFHQADPENDHRRDLDKVRVSANTAAQNIVVSITELNTAQGGTASRHHGAEHDEEDQKNASQNGLYGKGASAQT